MMAITHGFALGFDDPFGNSVWWNEQISFDVTDRIVAKVAAGIPGYNVVTFWSCDTLSGGNAPVAAFGLSGDDRAYAGFTDKVAINCWFKSTWDASGRGGPSGPYEATLADHAYYFWVSFQGGATFKEALDDANGHVMPHTIDPETGARSMLPMDLRGDQYATINFVYFTESERQLLVGSPNGVTVWLTKLPVTGN